MGHFLLSISLRGAEIFLVLLELMEIVNLENLRNWTRQMHWADQLGLVLGFSWVWPKDKAQKPKIGSLCQPCPTNSAEGRRTRTNKMKLSVHLGKIIDRIELYR